MKKLFWICLAISFCFGGEKRMTFEDSLALKNVGAPRFSPDGKWIAYTLSEWDRKENRRVSHIWVATADGSRNYRLTNGERGESSPEWSPDGARIAFLANRAGAAPASEESPAGGPRGGGGQVWVIAIAGGEAEKVTAEDGPVTAFRWSPDGKRMVFVRRDAYKDKADRDKRKKDRNDAILVDGERLYSHLWTIHVETKEKKRLTQGTFSATGPRWSPDGKWIAYTKSASFSQESTFTDISEDRNSDVYVLPSEGGAARQLTTNPAGDSNPEWSPDGKWIAYVSNTDAKSWAAKNDILLVSPEGGEPRNLTGDFIESAGTGLVWSPDGGTIYFSAGVGFQTQLYRASVSRSGKIARHTNDNRSYGQFDLSADGKWLAYTVTDDRTPEDIHVAPAGSGSARRITQANPQVNEFALAESEVIRWKGPDNFDVEGLLVKPLGYASGRRYPLILQIHGGPYGRFSSGFSGRAQVWAANGYAVLMPNPRGSTGYGHTFTVSNVGEWGGRDFQDIMAGVDAVIARGVADADKCVVMGGSYGGFMTFWTITQTNRFKAAIGHAGITDWYSFHGQTDIPGLLEYGFTGLPWSSTEVYRKWSPMSYVDKVRTPILITHGERDFRVPIAQGEQYYRALKKRDVEVQFVRYPREGHGITEPNHQIDVAARQLAWFDRHLGIERPKAGAASEP